MPTQKTSAIVEVAYCSLAQPVERMTVNHDVVSSSLTGAAKEKRTPNGVRFLFGFSIYFDDIMINIQSELGQRFPFSPQAKWRLFKPPRETCAGFAQQKLQASVRA